MLPTQEADMKVLVAMIVIALTLPAGAFAGSHDTRLDQREIPSSSLGVPPDLGRTPAVPSRLPTQGTDVAAPDQQASTSPARAPHSRERAEDADWGVAGLAVVAIFGVAGVTLGLALRQRHASAQVG
jgi:hypothetical protein